MLRSFHALTVLMLLGTVATPAVEVTREGDRWLLENERLQVRVDPALGRIGVREKPGGREWVQAPAWDARFTDVRAAEGPARGLCFKAPSGGGLAVTMTLREKGADLFVEIDLKDRGARIENLFVLEPFVPEPFAVDPSGAALVVADYCDGHLYPLDLAPFPRTWFDLWQIDMPWAGVCNLKDGSGHAIIVETPDDAFIRMAGVKRGDRQILAPQVGFRPSKGQFRYPRRFFYHFASTGGYVTLAKRYRAHAREEGLIVPFSEKVAKNPNIARIFGAPDVWGDASLKLAREAKAAGIEKMILHGRASPEEMKAINELGYLTSEYDNYTDILPMEAGKEVDAQHGRIPDDVVLKADGQRMGAWLTWDKKQYMKRCPALWLEAAKVVIPKVLEKRPFLGRFIDVTTAEALYECFDEKHPLTRSEKRRCGVDLFGYARSLGLVLGGEHGRWWAVPHLDYIEGMQSGGSYSWPAGHLIRPKAKDEKFTGPWGDNYAKWADYEKWGIGHQYRVPLWELVFHDCIVSTWYWGDASDFLLEAAPEVTPKKDAFNVLYGTIPILWANKEGGWHAARDTFLRTCRNTCKLHEVIAAEEMLSHEFVTPDRAVQRTRFSGGTGGITEVIVNFGDAPFEAQLGGKTYVLPKNGFAVKGPRIEQSLALAQGKPVTTIQAGSYRFTE